MPTLGHGRGYIGLCHTIEFVPLEHGGDSGGGSPFVEAMNFEAMNFDTLYPVQSPGMGHRCMVGESSLLNPLVLFTILQ